MRVEFRGVRVEICTDLNINDQSEDDPATD